MKILFIAPLPPPTNGQSLAASILFDNWNKNHDLHLVNMAKKKREQNILDRLIRGLEVFTFFRQVFKYRKNNNIVYLTLSESLGGNLKDILIYIICYNNISNFVVHMLGGAGMKKILEKNILLYHVNKFFLKKVKAVIVEGEIQYQTFAKVINQEKIHIIPNFAEDYLFSTKDDILKKYTDTKTINILYLSNLIYGKGYNELADAYIELTEDLQKKIKLTFVGGFKNLSDQELFFNKIKYFPGIDYLGNFISGNEKKNLYLNNHIFCLPTYYPFEGQPISILEAYATGCFIITTNHSGIPQIFKNGINGIEVSKKSSSSIRDALELVVDDINKLKEISLYNLSTSKRLYTTNIYLKAINNVIIGK